MTLRNRMLRAAAGAGAAPPVASDPQFNYVSLLLNDTGTNGQQNNTFLDSSSNNFTITRNGTPTQGSVTPYWPDGQWSNYFGGSGNYLTTPSISLGTSSFTLEAWVYRTAAKATEILASGTTSGGFNIGFESTGTVIEISRYNVAYIAQVSATVPLNQWFHIAVTRDGNSYRVFLNGTQVGSTATDSNSISASAYRITDSATSGNNVTGYVSNFRLVTGTALYTSNFTPSTTPLTAVSGTSLLTCQSNRFKDNSSNNFAITVTGTPTVQAFEPFEPASSYATSVGGSGYFDGSGDYLSLPDDNSFDFGTGDFTIECWVYPQNTAGTGVFEHRSVSSGTTPYLWYLRSTTLLPEFYTGTSYTATIATPLNAWSHIAVTRQGGTLRQFVNGQQAFSGTVTTALDSTSGVRIMASNDAAQYLGYMTNMRIIKGTAVYTSAFTPPTSPVTAITGTSLLLNCTNAGIYDAAVLNDLVTVGDAKVSTAQAKFGSSSMAFDGTGDYLTFPAGHNTAFGTGNFTVELWFYPINSSSTNYYLLDNRNTGQTATWTLLHEGTGANKLEWYTGATLIASGVSPNGSQWNHIAYSRSGTTGRLFLNGTQIATATDSANYSVASTISYIGCRYSAAEFLNGYIDDLRITKGYARYTANFTPPTAPFPTR